MVAGITAAIKPLWLSTEAVDKSVEKTGVSVVSSRHAEKVTGLVTNSSISVCSKNQKLMLLLRKSPNGWVTCSVNHRTVFGAVDKLLRVNPGSGADKRAAKTGRLLP